MKAKSIIGIIAVCIILFGAVFALGYTWMAVPGTYENTTDARALLDNPQSYDVSQADGIAEIIVKENLDKTNAMNDVASIVFDFRGFDTLGESFILLTAIAGSFVILSVVRKSRKEDSGK